MLASLAFGLQTLQAQAQVPTQAGLEAASKAQAPEPEQVQAGPAPAGYIAFPDERQTEDVPAPQARAPEQVQPGPAPAAQIYMPRMQQSAAFPAAQASNITTTKEWYGAPIVVADIAALGLMVGGIATYGQSPDLGGGLILTGLGAYVLGGPIVHFTETRVGQGFASLGVRVGLPLVAGIGGAFVGILANQGCEGEWCGLEGLVVGAAIGFGAGILAAPAIDHALLAYKPVKTRQLSLSVTPSYQPTTGQTGLTVKGTW
jgi:hypothetical protein